MWLADPSLPVVICEGEKKALASWALILAYVERFIRAVHGGYRPGSLAHGTGAALSARPIGPEGDRRDVKGVIPDFDRITWIGRKVAILFDRNVTSNDSVKAARRELTKELAERKADVEWIDLKLETGIADQRH